VVVTWTCERWPGPLRYDAHVEAAGAQLDERVSAALLSEAMVVCPGTRGQRLEGGTEQCTAGSVEEAREGNAALPGLEFQRPPVVPVALRREKGVLVSRVPKVGADVAKPHHRQVLSLREQARLLEGRCRRGRVPDCVRRAGHEREVGEAESSLSESGGGLSEPICMFSNTYGARSRRAGHRAVVLHPGDRARIEVQLFVICGCEARRVAREVELEPVDEGALHA
jgi:hypothetical protein